MKEEEILSPKVQARKKALQKFKHVADEFHFNLLIKLNDTNLKTTRKTFFSTEMHLFD